VLCHFDKFDQHVCSGLDIVYLYYGAGYPLRHLIESLDEADNVLCLVLPFFLGPVLANTFSRLDFGESLKFDESQLAGYLQGVESQDL
jgi:hypothetical protein